MSQEQQINMTDDEEDAYALNLCTLPSEVLLYIFDYLPARQLQKCRQVCQRWREIIDQLAKGLTFWKRYCKKEFPSVYKMALAKYRGYPMWFDIYRSLSLWRQLPFARENRDEFASASQVSEEIRNIEVLSSGLILVHRRSLVEFYESDTLELSTKRAPITGNYVHYTEIDDIVIVNDFQMNLRLQRLHHDVDVTFREAKYFVIAEKNIYYVTLDNEIYVCNLKDPTLCSTLVIQCDEPIMCLGYSNNHLHILTFDRNIYSIVDGNLELTCHLDDHKNLLNQIYEYNFLDRLDWYVFFQWMCVFRQRITDGPLREILTVHPYGDVVFVGCKYGVLRIYYKPFINGEFDFYNAQPVKQYNFMDRLDCPVLSRCPILKVDVMETDVGHTVFVAMPKKVAVIDFIHSCKRKSSEYNFRFNSFQRMKVLKIDENV